ncbi:MAG TPA: glycosyltransferase, partial [Gaiellaceae bacterium]|nr:glycosyltransferase [Gaiellaceae bacterium]
TRELAPDARFLFLGTGVPRKQVLEDLSLAPGSELVEVVQRYDTSELPALLAGATVGVYPSYTEGFGFGALELLAAGLPTVAYDIPGPRDILSGLSHGSLVQVGDAETLAARAAELLTLDPATYTLRSEACSERARTFRWRGIAQSTAAAYEHALGTLRGITA